MVKIGITFLMGSGVAIIIALILEYALYYGLRREYVIPGFLALDIAPCCEETIKPLSIYFAQEQIET